MNTIIFYTVMFPSPYWGLFFIDVIDFTVVNRDNCFRPHIGDYFLSKKIVVDDVSLDNQFPSPYWGLFFIKENSSR